MTDTSKQNAIADGERKMAELREQLKARLEAARLQSQAPTAPAVSNVSATNAQSHKPLNVNPGHQFAVFNGTSALKFGFNADGSEASADEKKAKVADFAKKLPMNYTINYPAIGEEKTQLFVFTDYTCPFCKRLDNDIAELNQKGITVRYLFYPRSYSAGPDQPAAKLQLEQMRRAWCAPDQNEAISELFSTRSIEDYKCEEVPEAKGRPDFPGIQHHFLGQLFDIEGTPAYFTIDGITGQGYTNAQKLEDKILPPK